MSNEKVLYHGSNREFDEFAIKPELAVTPKDSLAEGYGVYLTDSKEVAAAHGSIVYVVKVNEDDITDFTNKQTILDVINNISTDLEINITDYLGNMLELSVKGLLSGDISTRYFGEELCQILENDSLFYSDFEDKITYEEGCLMEGIAESFKKHIRSIIKYYDKSYGHYNYVCYKNPECLKIIKKEH